MALDASLSRLRRLAPVIATRTFLVGVFVVVYLVVWRPVRGWVATDVMGPALSRIDTPRSDRYSVSVGRRVVLVQHIDSSDRVGVGWADRGFAVFHFLEGEFYQGTSLAVPFLLLRADGRALFGAATPGADRSETKETEK